MREVRQRSGARGGRNQLMRQGTQGLSPCLTSPSVFSLPLIPLLSSRGFSAGTVTSPRHSLRLLCPAPGTFYGESLARPLPTEGSFAGAGCCLHTRLRGPHADHTPLTSHPASRSSLDTRLKAPTGILAAFPPADSFGALPKSRVGTYTHSPGALSTAAG